MITRIGEAEPIGGGGYAPTWRVRLNQAPPLEWRKRFLEVALGDDTIFAGGLRVQEAAILFPLQPGELRAGLQRIDTAIAEINAFDAPADEPERRSSAGNILVVDDQPELCAVTADILEDGGYRVTATADARRALRMAIEDGPQLLVTDVVMPLMNGRELAERVLAARPDMKVLFMSAYAVQGQIIPGAPFLSKPFTADDLLRAVAGALTPPPSPFRKRAT